MATGLDVANRAALALGAVQLGEPLEGVEMQLIIDVWNALIDSENIEQDTLFVTKAVPFSLTANKQTYTVGPAGDFAIPRPDFISSISMTYNQSPDYFTSLRRMDRQEFERMGTLTLPGLPDRYFFDNDNPASTLTIFPIPTQSYPIRMFIPQALSRIVDATDDLIFPNGYERWWVAKLAIEISPYFPGTTVSQALVATFQEAEGRVKRMNSKAERFATNGGFSDRAHGTMTQSAFTGRTWNF